MKTCSQCGVSKELTEFYGAPKNKDKLHKLCKKCYIANMLAFQATSENYRTYQHDRRYYNIKWIYGHRYNMLRNRATGYYKNKKHSSIGKPVLTREEYDQWCKENETIFMKIHKAWEKSGFKKALAPTIDRINNNGGYTPENMQWLTMSDNTKKGTKSVNV